MALKNKCITEGCNKQQYWGKYCKQCYDEEFTKNRPGISKRFTLK